MPERCPKCGSEMVEDFTAIPGKPRESIGFFCPLDDNHCRIGELEKMLGEVNADLASRRVLIKAVEDIAIAYGYSTTDGSVIKWISKQRGELLESLAKLRDLKSERDAALAQVVALREAALEAHEHVGAEGYSEGSEAKVLGALSNASATAQRVKDEIERDVREAVWDKVKDMWGASPMQFRAAILGEKENN